MVEPIHTPQDLKQIYQTRFRETADYRSKVWEVLTGFFEQWIPRDGAVLDLGCGYCEFINQVHCAEKFGMDLNPDSLIYAKNAKIFDQDCSQVWPINSNSLDVVFTSNFFEHLPTKATLESTLVQVFRCLKPGGRLIAMGPNVRHVPGDYWDFFDHYLPLTEKAMAEVLRKQGFEMERCVDRFMPYTIAGRIKYPSVVVKTYLALPLAWKIWGKQFLVVARKPL
jgi:SAM-dependent methyltransferase